MIYVIASIQAVAGHRARLVEAFMGVLDTVRAKPGCLEYTLALHCDSGLAGQAPYDDDVVTLVERWSTLDALKTHIADPNYLSWFSEQLPIIETASMQVLSAVR